MRNQTTTEQALQDEVSCIMNRIDEYVNAGTVRVGYPKLRSTEITLDLITVLVDKGFITKQDVEKILPI